MGQFHTATLSHDDIRGQLYRLIDTAYTDRTGPDTCFWPILFDVYDGYCFVKARINGKMGLYKIRYRITDDDRCELVGEPEALTEENVSARAALEASNVLFGDDASELIAGLVKQNPLFSALQGNRNTHFVVFDLTTVGRTSQHKGPVKYRLAKAGMEAALPTLISKPIHVTPKFDGHVEAKKDPKPVGVFLGGVPVENEDGTVTIRAVGTLWEADFPSLVEAIQEQKADLGASYEIAFLETAASRVAPDVIEISSWHFSGGAILKKTAAAHPETQLLVADTVLAAPITTKERNDLPDSDFAYVKEKENGKKDRRFPIHDEAHRKNAWSRANQDNPDLSAAEMAAIRDKIMARAKKAGDEWAKDYRKVGGKWVKKAEAASRRLAALVASTDALTGGGAMKLVGIPEEYHQAVQQLVAEAVKQAQSEGAMATLKAEHDRAVSATEDMKKKHQEMEKKVADAGAEAAKLTNELNVAKADLQKAVAERDELKTKLAELDMEKKAEETLVALGSRYGFDPADQKIRAERLPIIKKHLSGQVLTVDEIATMTKTGSAAPRRPVPLYAGAEPADAPTRESVSGMFPTLKKLMAK